MVITIILLDITSYNQRRSKLNGPRSAIAAVAAVKRSLDDLPEQTLATLQEVRRSQRSLGDHYGYLWLLWSSSRYNLYEIL